MIVKNNKLKTNELFSFSSKPFLQSTIYNRQSAFTIVELLVVIVVIGILSAIVYVSYSGITAKATESIIKSELSSNNITLKLYKSETGSYPIKLDSDNCPISPIVSSNHCLKVSRGNALSYVGGGLSFVLIESNLNKT